MSSLTPLKQAYLAGLLDGDGSIMLQLKKRPDMRWHFRVKTVVVFYQDSRYMTDLTQFKLWFGAGYVYRRNDRISEYRVEGFAQVKRLLVLLLPYLRFKKKQAEIMLQAILILETKYGIDDLFHVCQLADAISELNYKSSQRKYTAEYVRRYLDGLGLVPVTTGA
jgi:hypothetical protein